MALSFLLSTIRKQLIETHGFPENRNKPGYVKKNVVPNGVYPIIYHDREIDVLIENQRIIRCNK